VPTPNWQRRRKKEIIRTINNQRFVGHIILREGAGYCERDHSEWLAGALADSKGGAATSAFAQTYALRVSASN